MTMTNGSGCGHSAGLHSACPICARAERLRQDDRDDRDDRDHGAGSARGLLADWERRTDALLAELAKG